METARADYNGLFTSSSLTASRMLNERTQISAGGYHAGLYVEDYSESGSAANLNVGDRNVHVASLRAEAKFTAVQVSGYGNLFGGLQYRILQCCATGWLCVTRNFGGRARLQFGTKLKI